LDIDELLATVIRRAAALSGTDNGCLCLLNKKDNKMAMRVGIGFYQPLIAKDCLYNEGLIGKVWASGTPLLIPDYDTWEGRNSSLQSGIHTTVAIPLKSADQTIGVLTLLHVDSIRTFTADDQDLLTHFAELVSIALDNAELYSSAQYLSMHDPLTGLYNRNYFEEELSRLERSRDPGGIIVCDVDNLKVVNDALGHAAGDALLIAVADVLRQAFRGSDIVARIGGDEFAMLLPQQSTHAIQVANY
jgi:GGDEF domain-containing protein